MFKKNSKIILIIILIVQLALPFTMFFHHKYLNSDILEKGTQATLKVDMIWFSEDELWVELNVDSIHPLTYSEDNYLVFENRDGCKFTPYYTQEKKPATDSYLVFDKVYDLNSISVRKDGNGYGWWSIYDRECEFENIQHGVCKGPEFDVYAVITVYKGNFKLVDVYINGLTLEEYVKECENGNIDLDRFEYNAFDTDFDFGEYWENLDDDTKDMMNDIAENVLGDK